MRKVILVGYDVAPCAGLSALGEELGDSAELFLAKGGKEPVDHEALVSAVRGASVVVTGFSSSEMLAEIEILAAKVAMENGIPLGHYQDTFDVFTRPWMVPFRNYSSFLFVLNEGEAEQARELFPNADVVPTGSPIFERAFFPEKNRNESRVILEASDDQLIVLIPLGKVLVENVLELGTVIEAARFVDRPADHVRFVVTLHPGDKNDREHYRTIAEACSLPTEISELSSADCLPGADLVIATISAVAIEAACQRIPAIDLFNEVVWARTLELGTSRVEEDGARVWPRSNLGITELSDEGPQHLANLVSKLLFTGWSETKGAMKLAQEAALPAPKRQGQAAEAMVKKAQEILVRHYA